MNVEFSYREGSTAKYMENVPVFSQLKHETVNVTFSPNYYAVQTINIAPTFGSSYADLLDLPDPIEAESIVKTFPTGLVSELTVALLKAALTACKEGSLMRLAYDVSDWVATAEEYSFGSDSLEELISDRNDMNNGRN